jgi:short-subunit dehydrogenase
MARTAATRKTATTRAAPREAAVITGASGGIGLELARLFARDGTDVVLVARSGARLRAIAAELSSQYPIRATAVALDVSREDAGEALMRRLQRARIAPLFLVNNAGFGLYGRFVETEWEREAEMIALNVTALTRLTKVFLQAMVAQGRGRIMNVASTAAFQPGPMMAVYYATKAYVLSFTEAVASEVASSGVTVTALCPGPTHSGFQQAADLGGSRVFEGRVMGRIMEADEVARLGYEGMMRGEAVVVTGLRNQVLAQAARMLPRPLVTRVSRWAIETVPGGGKKG